MTAARHPEQAAATARGTLRTERTTTTNIYDDAGQAVIRHFTYLDREYAITGAPDLRDFGVNYATRPTGVQLHWSRMNTDAWELQTVSVRGVRVLKSGRAGTQQVPSRTILSGRRPEWLTRFIEANRPAV